MKRKKEKEQTPRFSGEVEELVGKKKEPELRWRNGRSRRKTRTQWEDRIQ